MDQVLKTRTITGVVFGLIVISLLTLGGHVGVKSLAAIVMVFGVYEYLTMAGYTYSLPMAIAISLFWSMLALYFDWDNVQKGILSLITLLFYLLGIVGLYLKTGLNHKKILPFSAIIYPCMSLALLMLNSNVYPFSGRFWLFILLLIWISDTGAYLVGRKLGKRKLFERISPKKTWEGSIGAAIFTCLAAVVISNFSYDVNLIHWIFIGLIVLVFGTYGDLVESSIKRYFAIKDSGNVLPGHGGFLDRFDSFIYAIPFVIIYVTTFCI
jgi:phosphatidate cytidylyltransferase